MHMAFIVTELPYPLERNGLSLINYRLAEKAPAWAKVHLVVLGQREDTDVIARFRECAPQIQTIHFAGKFSSRLDRLLSIISGVIFGDHVFGYNRLAHIEKELGFQFDLVYVCPLLAPVRLKTGRSVFLNAVDSFSRFNEVSYFYNGRWSSKVKAWIYSLYESRVLRTVGRVNFVSSVDLGGVIARTPDIRAINISNGVDTRTFYPCVEKGAGNRLLFVGNFNYGPNRAAAELLVRNIFPRILIERPDASLHLVGPSPNSDWANGVNVFVHGFVADVSVYYRQSDIFVCPLFSGAGVKNKILEAMASGLAVVSTPLGVDGIDFVRCYEHYLLAFNGDEFVDKVVSLISNEDQARGLGERACAAVRANCSWGSIVDQYYTEFATLGRN